MAGLTLTKGASTRSARAPRAAVAAVEAKLAGLGVTITEVDTPVLGDASGEDWVVGVGAAGRAAAEAFASAMGRPYRAFETYDEVVPWVTAQSGDSAFVFLPEPAFHVRGVPEMIEESVANELAVGWFPVPNDVAEAVADALRLVALSLSDAPNTWAPIVYAHEAPAGEAPAIFADADMDSFRERAREGCAAIVLEGHGNGCDFRLGANALCVQADLLKPTLARRGEAALPCQFGGPCLRRECNFVGISELKTSILVVLTCTGWLAHGGLLDPRFGLTAAALRGPWVRAIMTTIEVSQPPWMYATAAADFLAQGGELGEMTRLFNAQMGAGARPFVCIGDPTTTMPSPVRTEGFTPTAPAATPEAPVDERPGPGTFRALLVRELLAMGILGDDPRLAALPERVKAGEDVSRAFAEVIGSYTTHRSGFVSEFYGSRSRPADGVTWTDLEKTGLRHVCGANILRAETQAHPGYAVGRTQWVCRRCGCVGETPTGVALPSLRFVGPRTIRIEETPFEPMWMVSSVESTGDVRGVAHEAIEVAAGAAFEIDLRAGGVDAGLQVLAICIAWREDYVVMRLPFLPEA